MFTHDPNGTTLVIHSVVIAASNRRKGIGKRMLLEYIYQIASKCPRIEKLLLLSKPELWKFYITCGFGVVGLSSVIHGKV
jgi:N-acetylglutamate synthase-like GNAT family acetyltransferase